MHVIIDRAKFHRSTVCTATYPCCCDGEEDTFFAEKSAIFFSGSTIGSSKLDCFTSGLTVVDNEVPCLVVVGDVSQLRLEAEYFLVSLEEPVVADQVQL